MYNRHARCALDLARVTEERNSFAKERDELVRLVEIGRDKLVTLEQRLAASIDGAADTIDKIERERLDFLRERDLALKTLSTIPPLALEGLSAIIRARDIICKSDAGDDVLPCQPPMHVYVRGYSTCKCGGQRA